LRRLDLIPLAVDSGGGIDDPGYNRSLDSVHVLAYECASGEPMEATRIYFILFGVLTIAGGIVGYFKAGSVASIIAGSITGVLLLVAAFLLPQHRGVGLATALVVSLLLAGQFVPKFLQTGRVMPAGMMSILSVIGVVTAIVAWIKK
jgi:uncharacterized membrane protein (UPF0136 family)